MCATLATILIDIVMQFLGLAYFKLLVSLVIALSRKKFLKICKKENKGILTWLYIQ